MIYLRTGFFLLLSFYYSFNYTLAQGENRPFKLNSTKEAVIIGMGTIAGISALAILLNKDPLTPEELNALNPLDVNRFDRTAIGTFVNDGYGDVILRTSHFLPLTFLAYNETRKDFGDLILMYGEVMLINLSINGIVKGLTERVRPYVYDEQSPIEEKKTIDARLSFYSGHTSITASTTFFTAKVFSEYLSNSTAKILIWSAAALVPAITGFSRIHTHWHFPTDVIVGYVVGAAIGYIIPLIHKNDNDNNNQITPADNFYKPLIGFKFNF